MNSADAASVKNCFIRQSRVIGEMQQRVRPDQRRVIEHGDLEIAGFPTAIFDVVTPFLGNLVEARAKNGVGQMPLHGDAFGLARRA